MSWVSAIRCLLAIALVHQAGAGTCGCLEHNGWLQAGQALIAPDAFHSIDVCHSDWHASHPVDGDTPVWDHHDCDTAPPFVCLAASRVDTLAWSTISANLASESDPDLAATSLTISSTLSSDRLSAQPLRAALQVFRL